MARWGDEKTLNFIFLYRNHECLWNVQSPLYKNKISRENAYQSLLKSLNDDNLNIKSVKTKIKNLRSIYHTELKKIKNSKRSGSKTVYKPRLLWFDEMHSFLGDSSECRETTSSEIKIQVSSEESTSVLSTQDSYESTLQPNLSNFQLIHNNSLSANNNSEQNTNEATLQHGQQFIKTKLVRKKRQTVENSILNVLRRLENISKIVNTTPQQPTVHAQDEFYFFALSVAAQLRNLPLPMAVEAQRKIKILYLPLECHQLFQTHHLRRHHIATTLQSDAKHHIRGKPKTTIAQGRSKVEMGQRYVYQLLAIPQLNNFITKNIQRDC